MVGDFRCLLPSNVATRSLQNLVLQLYFSARAVSCSVVAGFGEGLVAATPERAGECLVGGTERVKDETHEQAANFRNGQRDQRSAPFFTTRRFRLRRAFARMTASIA